MSRAVRRVPVGFKHPVEPNPHWQFQALASMGGPHPPSRMHGPTDRFVSLQDDYPRALATWEEDLRALKARQGFDWRFAVEYHLTGFKGRGDTEAIIHPYYVYDDGGPTAGADTADREIEVPLRDVDHLHELEVAKAESERPNPDLYMPVFDVPADQLGWCLYETVSEGTPVTPVFDTAEQLVDWLVTKGQDWDQVPMRRAAAAALVSAGGTMGSMASVGGRLYKSDMDADLLNDALSNKGATS